MPDAETFASQTYRTMLLPPPPAPVPGPPPVPPHPDRPLLPHVFVLVVATHDPPTQAGPVTQVAQTPLPPATPLPPGEPVLPVPPAPGT